MNLSPAMQALIRALAKQAVADQRALVHALPASAATTKPQRNRKLQRTRRAA